MASFRRAWSHRFVRVIAVTSCIGGIVVFSPTAVSAGPTSTELCTPSTGFTDCLRFVYTGSPSSFTVPANVDSATGVRVEVWGAGGGSNGSYWVNGAGAGGGFTTANLDVSGITSLVVTVGRGGRPTDTTGSFGGGGAGGAGSVPGASGGGMSGVWTGTPSTTTALLIAGGGGGGSPGSGDSQAGGGGGSSGSNDTIASLTGRSGTQIAGGVAASNTDTCPTGLTSGSELQGGTGGGNTNFASTQGVEGGGGGGGGWFGGGGGRCQENIPSNPRPQNGGGGGGSGFVSTSAIVSGSSMSTANVAGVGVEPDPGRTDALGSGSAGASSDQYVAGIGKGADAGRSVSPVSGEGGDGMVVLQWVTLVPEPERPDPARPRFDFILPEVAEDLPETGTSPSAFMVTIALGLISSGLMIQLRVRRSRRHSSTY